MVLDKLGQTLKNVTDKIASTVFVDKKLIDSVVKDLQRAMLQADIDVKLVKELSNKIREEGKNEKIKGVDKKEHIIKIIHDTLLEILGKEKKELKLEKKGKKKEPEKVMLIGTYGSGKTTTISKLTNYYKKRGLKTCMLGLDVHRPAAAEQLEQLGKKHNLDVFIDKDEKKAEKIYKKYEKKLKEYDVVFVDTAGRHSLDKELVKEIKNLGGKISPSHTILVITADIGQAAKKQAEEFQSALDVNGVIVTRMDSTAKGGGALTACNEVDAPVYFITTGEKIHDIESFNPTSFISRILGMGSLDTLIEKVQSAVDEGKSEKMKKRLEEGKFTMDDLYEQLKSMKGFSLDKVASMIPGFGKMKNKVPEGMLGKQEENMEKWKYAIQSMTKEEKENPEILNKEKTRIQRIAKGSGITTSEVKSLLKQYKMLKEFASSGKDMQNMDEKQMKKLAKKFGGKMKF